MIQLDSQQRKFLSKAAHSLQPHVFIGKEGLKESIVQSLYNDLEANEISKVKFIDYKEEKQQLAEELALQTDAILIRIIGNIAIFYKPAQNKENQKIKLPALKKK
ncbi:MAG: YhbY family RNA-binding protein [Spirochaetes bacterium]|nr:YhbY family RNA-binding protein [Spirochaetota bacterium]